METRRIWYTFTVDAFFFFFLYFLDTAALERDSKNLTRENVRKTATFATRLFLTKSIFCYSRRDSENNNNNSQGILCRA